MDSDHQCRVRQLFDAVQALSAAERADFLENECGSHRLLRAEVESLLIALDENREFLELPGGLPESLKEAAGRVIGDYRIIRRIGSGGMAEVYEAEQVSLKRSVALKLLPPLLNLSEQYGTRFQREAEAGSRLNHLNIITVHTVGEADDTSFIAMELAGESLHDLIERCRKDAAGRPDGTAAVGAVHCRRMVRLFAEVADALARLHEAGIVHRDIKPSNLLFGYGGRRLMISDFGLAHIEDATRLTRSKDLLGTFRYMSPEQLEDHRREIDHRTDIWSLGVSLYEAVTLEFPFRGESDKSYLASVRLDEPIPARKRTSAILPDLENILMKCLEKEPSRRYPTADALRADLVGFIEDGPVNARRKSLVRRSMPALRRFAVIPVLVVIVVLGGAWLWAQLFNGSSHAVRSLQQVDDYTIRCVDQSGSLLWMYPSETPIRGFTTYDENNANRFAVMCGGWWNGEGPSEHPPSVYILDPDGAERASVDLLEYFNPFKDQYSEKHFALHYRLSEDLDRDGWMDLVVDCKHYFSPDIIYIISGQSLACSGAFANSGHSESYQVDQSDCGDKSGMQVLVVAKNNAMGEQGASFFLSRNAKLFSPDLLGAREFLIWGTNYRPLGLMPEKIGSITLDKRSWFEVHGFTSPFQVEPMGDIHWQDQNGMFTDPRLSHHQYQLIYLGVHRAREMTLSENAEEGYQCYMDLHRDAAADPPLEFYIRYEAVNTLMKAGRADLALDLLPEAPDQTVFPRQSYLISGKVHLILEHYDRAMMAFRTMDAPSYSIEGFVNASILKGLQRSEIQSLIETYYPTYERWSEVRAWMLIPQLLRSRPNEATALVDTDELDWLYDAEPSRENSHPQEIEIWTAWADITEGRKPARMPDQEFEPAFRDESYFLKLQAVEALNGYQQAPSEQTLDDLEQAHLAFLDSARKNHKSMVPSVLLAYQYGFVALNSPTHRTTGLQALEYALSIFPHGAQADLARQIIASAPDTPH